MCTTKECKRKPCALVFGTALVSDSVSLQDLSEKLSKKLAQAETVLQVQQRKAAEMVNSLQNEMVHTHM